MIQTKPSANAENVKIRYNSPLQVKKGKTFTIAFWAKVNAKEGDRRGVILSGQTVDVPLKTLLNKTVILDSTGWKEYTLSFVVPENVEGDIFLSFLVGLSDVDFWFDDFRFFEGEPADEISGTGTSVKPMNKRSTFWGGIKRSKGN